MNGWKDQACQFAFCAHFQLTAHGLWSNSETFMRYFNYIFFKQFCNIYNLSIKLPIIGQKYLYTTIKFAYERPFHNTFQLW